MAALLTADEFAKIGWALHGDGQEVRNRYDCTTGSPQDLVWSELARRGLARRTALAALNRNYVVTPDGQAVYAAMREAIAAGAAP